MFRFIAPIFALFPLIASAQSTPDTYFKAGLAATEAQYAEAKTGEDLFVLGAVRFLRGVENTMQMRWQMGMNDMGSLPVLRLGIAPNPSPDPFDPGVVEQIFAQVQLDMAKAREALQSVGDTEFSVTVDFKSIWVDADRNGIRSNGEGILTLAASSFGGRGMRAFAEMPDAPTIVDFDRSDLDWLIAYTHLLSGIADVVIGYQPEEAIAQVVNAETEIAELAGGTSRVGMGDAVELIRLATIYLTAIETKPDVARGQSANAHFLEMIAANKRFWARVEAETDNQREWIPNDRQTSALGLPFPEGTGAAWQAVLADAEALLNGELLIPYWRTGASAGLNLKRLLNDPPSINLIGWIHGMDALPYIEKGPVMSRQNWRAFERLMSGRGTLFAVMLN